MKRRSEVLLQALRHQALPLTLGLTLVTPVSLVLANASASSSASAKAGTQTSAAKPALTVTTVKPVNSNAAIKIHANGNVYAWQEAIIGAEANGVRIAELHVNVGDKVKKGQLLASLSADMVRAELAQAQASLAEAKAAYDEAAANAERVRQLKQSGAYSQQQIEQFMTLEQTSKARWQATQAAVQLQQTRLRQTQIVAPDAGVISARTASVGAVVGAGVELFKMLRQGRLEWRAEVTAAEMAKISPGMSAQIIGPNAQAVTGKVRMVAPTVDLQSRNGLIYVDLPGSADQAGTIAGLRAGMFAKGELLLGDSPALSIAQSAIVVRDGYNYVFKVNADQRVTQVKVQTGRRFKNAQAEQVEILQGLTADAQVVASGAGFLNDGDLVKVVAAAAPATAGKAPAPASK